DTPWFHLEPQEALDLLDSAPAGIAELEALQRRERVGPNRLPRGRPTPWWTILLNQFTGVVVLLLVAAALVSVAIGEMVEAVAIAGVLVINAGIGFGVELRARRVMGALLAFEAPVARVRRPSGVVSLASSELVPGDVIEVEEGHSVPADARLLDSSGLRVDEAALTGESVPVDKTVHPVGVGVVLAERSSMVHSGTTVVAGRGVAVVTGTGAHTEVGRIGSLLAEVEVVETPLERRLNRLGRRLVGLTLVVATFTALLGIVRGAPVGLMVETGIALAIAAVPEGLPAVATIALAIGLRRMARRHALVRRLAAVEALGSTTVVCTDKTGTLTAGRMTATRVEGAGQSIRVTGTGYSPAGTFLEGETEVDAGAFGWLLDLLQTCALSNRAAILDQGEGVAGDPTDAALLVLAQKGGVDAENLARSWPLVDEVPFDSELRLSASIHDHESGRVSHVKGAPDALVARSTRWASADGEAPLGPEMAERVRADNQAMAADGLRVIGLARGPDGGLDDLTFLGLVGILDPPAEGVAETIATLRSAGIATVVVTGDQRPTAEAVAKELGTLGDRPESLEGQEITSASDEELAARSSRVGVYSRVSPRDKVRIVSALQSRGDVVAMIGDGVNDAAALKKADIGVAMGLRGTDVAKDASAIVLSDDRFPTIGAAVEEGRVIFDNIRKFVFYLFSCNLAEVATIVVASLAGAPVPLLPLQILWLNLVTDTFPALALALEPAEPGIMSRGPLGSEANILSKRFVRSIAFYAGLITVVTLVAFGWGLATGETERAITLAFMTLALAQLFHLGNARSRGDVLAPTRIVANPAAVAAVPLVVALQLLAVYWPPLAGLLGTTPLGVGDWLGVAALALVPAVVGQFSRRIRRKRS
ncbi:MAG: HAD-IC family P-type ATPase, partial [Gemmatimonadetes bacterium]|nr:HAD-IC family P-type ATPase [Gemmatimonadota bacterium]